MDNMLIETVKFWNCTTEQNVNTYDNKYVNDSLLVFLAMWTIVDENHL